MLKVGICDDTRQVCLQIERILLEYKIEAEYEIIVEIFYSGEDLCKTLNQGERIDLLFLDIELTGMNGVKVGHFIREELKDEMMKIIYISGKNSYYRELFDIRPMNFMNKPISSKELIRNLEKAVELLEKEEKVFVYEKEHKICRIKLKDILYFEVNKREIIIVTNKEKVYFYGTLREVYKKVEDYYFLYTHQSYIVNAHHVAQYGRKEIVMSNGQIIPVSRRRVECILDYIRTNIE